MKITTDTNLLVRLFVEDDREQTEAVRRLVAEADGVVIPIPALCEFVWVLRTTYGQSREGALQAIEMLTQIDSVVLDRPIVEAGLAIMREGGDFADGAIAEDGRSRGATIFASFDHNAVKRLVRSGIKCRLVVAASTKSG